MLHLGNQPLISFRVIYIQKIKGAIAEHHPEAPCVALGILFEDIDGMAGMVPFQQVAQVQPGWTTTDDGNFHKITKIDLESDCLQTKCK